MKVFHNLKLIYSHVFTYTKHISNKHLKTLRHLGAPISPFVLTYNYSSRVYSLAVWSGVAWHLVQSLDIIVKAQELAPTIKHAAHKYV